MRWALGIEYDGQAYHGWQFQVGLPTVQGCLQEALAKVASHPIEVYCAGRTDRGVHARGQVIHFETDVSRVSRAWVLGTNAYLPENISVKWVRAVDDRFHARFSAIARRYQYVIDNSMTRPALFHKRVTWQYEPLDIEAMRQATECLIGEKDFSSFRSAECESKSPMRLMKEITIERRGHLVIIELEANAFLHHMVRNIVGVLIRIGRKNREVSWMETVLAAKDRRKAAETAPASGLYLLKVIYPPPYIFPAVQAEELRI